MRRNTSLTTVFYIILFITLCFMFYNFSGLQPKIKTQFSILRNPQDRKNDSDFITVLVSKIMTGEPIVLTQNNETILKYIWDNKLLEPPSMEPYNLSSPDIDPSKGQAQFIRKYLKNMTNGFFVECGALDGETRSNSLFMEMHLAWKGLLIEADPSNYALLQKKHRKAWSSNTCLAVKPYPHKVKFEQNFNIGKIMDENQIVSKKRKKTKIAEVQCMPLFSLLAALNITTVDYFSLDVEGNELQVLKTIPFDKVYIKTLSVEFFHTVEGKRAILEFMKSKGYTKIGTVRHPLHLANDFLFAHKDL